MAPCLKYEEYFMQHLTHVPLRFQALLRLNSFDLTRYEKFSGLNLTTMHQVASMFDTIMSEKIVGNVLGIWTDEIYPGGLDDLVKDYKEIYAQTPILPNIKAGPLIHKIREFLSHDKDREPIKFTIYSGDDSTLASLRRALQLRQLPSVFNYTSTLAFELYEGKNAEELVKVKKRIL